MVDTLLDVVTLSALVGCVGFGVRWYNVSRDLDYLGQVPDPLSAEQKAEMPLEIRKRST